jgi:phosphoglycolate phosphatase
MGDWMSITQNLKTIEQLGRLPLQGWTIAFDLDGTLVDTAPDLLRALNETLEVFGIAGVPDDKLRGLVGQGARVLLEKGAALSGQTFSANAIDQAVSQFLSIYKADIAALSLPFPGMVEALETLETLGARLVVCTNKPTLLSIQLLLALGLAARFRAIIGPEDAPKKKPDPSHLQTAIVAAGGRTEKAIMFGDSSSDTGTAHGLNVPCIVAAYGYLDEPAEQLSEYVISHPDELVGMVLRIAHPHR